MVENHNYFDFKILVYKKMSNFDIPCTTNTNIKTKVYIQRDYTEGMIPKFQDKMPPELDGLIDPEVFQNTINKLNLLYKEAETIDSKTYCEGILSCLSGYLILLCSKTKYEKCLKKVKQLLKEENDNVYWPKNVLIVDPYSNGLRSIEIRIYN